MSTLVFVDLESSTQADGAQSSRVPVPLPEDPYEAIRQAYLDGTNTESEPFEDLIDTETPESPFAISPPIPLSESTPPVLVPILRRTARMAERIPHAMSTGLSAGMAEVAAMSESLEEDSEEDDDEEDEEIEESMDSDSDAGLTAGVEGPGIDDKGYGLDDESRGINDEGHSVESDGFGLKEEKAVPRGQQQAAPVVGMTGSGSAPESKRHERVSAFRQPTLTTWTDPKDGMIYIDIPDYPPSTPPVQTPPSLDWTSGSLLISSSPSDNPSPISSPMIPLTIPSPVATPAAVETEGFLTELEAQVQMHGGLINDHVVRLKELSSALFERYDRDIGELFTRSGAVREEIFSQRYRFRSLEYEQERVAVTFRVIWRPVLALEAWAGQRDA
ncbi:hypothetical protein Tco_1357896 [Tanacetum coccineum]